jgi:phospholipid/cholesterol/gamma-HCH transport system permease protein
LTSKLKQLLEVLGFCLLALKECLSLYLQVLVGRRRFDLKRLILEIKGVGLSMLPVITLMAMAIGLILGIQAVRWFAPEVLITTIAVTVVREFAPLLVGIFIAGRSGVALTVRIGSMVHNREIDGLIACGVNPVHYTLGPMLPGVLLMSFAFAIWTPAVMLSVTASYFYQAADISFSLFYEGVLKGIKPGDLVIAVLKPLTFSLLTALIATAHGSLVGRDSDSISKAATRTMIGALLVIILTDLLFVLGGKW